MDDPHGLSMLPRLLPSLPQNLLIRTNHLLLTTPISWNGMSSVKALVPLRLLYTLVILLLVSLSLLPWVLDYATTDHIFGNQALLSHLSTSGYLPTITLANVLKPSLKGLAQPIPYPPCQLALGSQFNLLSISRLTYSLNCIVSFTKDCLSAGL